MGTFNLESLGICSNGDSTEVSQSKNWACPFPNYRLIDGGLVGENPSVIASLVEMYFRSDNTPTPSMYTYPGEPGAAMNDYYYGYEMYSPQIFAEKVPADWITHGEDTTYRTLSVTVTTVENKVFGIRGGDTVELLVIFGNKDLG